MTPRTPGWCRCSIVWVTRYRDPCVPFRCWQPGRQMKGGGVTVVQSVPGTDVLVSWAATRQAQRRGGTARCAAPAQLRFAFYGRVSTEEYQDQASSARWQMDFANELVAGRGRIVAEFFDIGCSRRLP